MHAFFENQVLGPVKRQHNLFNPWALSEIHFVHFFEKWRVDPHSLLTCFWRYRCHWRWRGCFVNVFQKVGPQCPGAVHWAGQRGTGVVVGFNVEKMNSLPFPGIHQSKTKLVLRLFNFIYLLHFDSWCWFNSVFQKYFIDVFNASFPLITHKCWIYLFTLIMPLWPISIWVLMELYF